MAAILKFFDWQDNSEITHSEKWKGHSLQGKVEPANRRFVVPIGRVAIDLPSDGTSSISVMSRLSFYSALSLQQPNCQWRYDGIPHPSFTVDTFISLALERNPCAVDLRGISHKVMSESRAASIDSEIPLPRVTL